MLLYLGKSSFIHKPESSVLTFLIDVSAKWGLVARVLQARASSSLKIAVIMEQIRTSWEWSKGVHERQQGAGIVSVLVQCFTLFISGKKKGHSSLISAQQNHCAKVVSVIGIATGGMFLLIVLEHSACILLFRLLQWLEHEIVHKNYYIYMLLSKHKTSSHGIFPGVPVSSLLHCEAWMKQSHVKEGVIVRAWRLEKPYAWVIRWFQHFCVSDHPQISEDELV